MIIQISESQTHQLEQLRNLMRQSLVLRSRGDAEGEEQILERLDSLFYRLSETNRDVANAFVSHLSNACLDEDGNVIRDPFSVDREPEVGKHETPTVGIAHLVAAQMRTRSISHTFFS